MGLTHMALQRPTSLTDEFLEKLVARVPSTSGGSWKLTEVYTGDLLVELPQSTPADVEAAYAAAREVQVEWAARPLKERLAVFKRAHTLFIDNAQTTTDLIQAESGKNRRMAIEEFDLVFKLVRLPVVVRVEKADHVSAGAFDRVVAGGRGPAVGLAEELHALPVSD